MNPLFHTEFSISDSLKNVRKSVLIYETIILFRTAIDYILIPNDKYIVKNIGIKEYDNSDHLCIFTEIQEC